MPFSALGLDTYAVGETREQMLESAGKVVEGKDVIKKFYSGYGEKVMARGGNTEVFRLGNDYLKNKWPELDYIKSASIVE